MNIIQELAIWANTLPLWQSDAVRRVFSQEKLSSEEEGQVFEMLLAAHDLSDSDATPRAPKPFSYIVDAAQPGSRKVVLKELHSLDNVNALVPGQSVKFALEGITVIYGENGAGKSGYARVFKHACHARDKGAPIFTNVVKPTKTNPAATVELLVDGQDIAVRWKANAPASELLPELSVFDSHCARVFIDDANEVVYLPYGLDTFPKLASLFATLKERITKEIREIPAQFELSNDYTDKSAAGRFIKVLSAQSDENQIDALSSIDSDGLTRLHELRVLVASAKTNSPKIRAAQLRRTKVRLEQLKARVITIATALAPDALLRLMQLQISADIASRAAKLATVEAFSGDPIAATGSEPWRVLFNAARSFSGLSAYPEEVFPVTRDGAVCLLCQQPLLASARDRLIRFEQFVKNETARRVEETVAALQKEILNISELKVITSQDDPSLIEEIGVYDPVLADEIVDFLSQASMIRTRVMSAIAEHRPLISGSPPDPIDRIASAIIALEAQAQQYERADNPEEFKKLVDELNALDDSAKLRNHSDLVRKYIAFKKREVSLKKCERDLDTIAITRRGSELMEQAVTEQLIANLTAELTRFGVQCVPVQVKKSGQKGKTKHQLVVSEVAKPSGILSEGEQRIIALSSFLAELRTAGSRAPIIFDDPVSSLDHRFREKVAHRLVEESKARQVVVFTHDVVLLLALEREAAEQQVPLLIQTISKTPAGPGECIPSGQRPWYACNTKERISQLKCMTAKFKKLQVDSADDYRRAVAEFYGRLREAWERAIEELLFQDVIQRFRPSIETQRLRKVTIDPADYVPIDNGMSKCSRWMTGHDGAAALGTPPPSSDDVAADLNAFEEFTKRLKDRAEKTGRESGTLVDAPEAQVSSKRAETVIDLTAI